MDKRRRRPSLGNRAYKEYSKEMLEVAVDLAEKKFRPLKLENDSTYIAGL